MAMASDPMGASRTLSTATQTVIYYSLDALAGKSGVDLDRLPYTIKVLLENVLRHCDGKEVTPDDVLALARWGGPEAGTGEFPFLPARVLLQDFTGVPAV